MGNAISRSLGLRDGGPSTIDGGTTRLKSDTDPVVPGTRRRKIEYDISIVEKMIKNRRLAPFFQDLSESAEEEKDLNTSEVTDPSGGVGSNCELPDNNHEVRVKDAKSSIFNENLDNVDDEEYGGVGSFDSRGNLNSGPVLLKSENSLRTIEEPAVREKIGKGRKKGKKEMKLEKASQVEAMVKNFVRIRNAECPICFIVSLGVDLWSFLLL